MTTYFFDTQTDEIVHKDETGLDRRDDEAAKREALRAMAELTRDHMPLSGPDRTLLMTVRRENTPIFEIITTLRTIGLSVPVVR